MTNILSAVPSKKEKLPLSVTHPELAKEANGWDPSDYSSGSNQNVEWLCPIGHSYKLRINKRVARGTNCLVCSNHLILSGYNDLLTTSPELASEAFGWDPSTTLPGGHTKLQWRCSSGHTYSASIINRLRNGSGCPFCSGLRALPGFNDLATTHPALAKEAFGWNPSEVRSGSHKKLLWQCNNGHQYRAAPQERTKSNDQGCRYCSRSKVLPGFNDLATTHPELAKEAFGWNPSTILSGSQKKVSWTCSQGHTFEATPSARSSINKGAFRAPKGTNCPFCAGKSVLELFNDLATTHPAIALEADGWDPRKINSGSNKKLNWKCSFGHKWQSVVNNRTSQGLGCPICSGQKVLPGFNDLLTTHPELAREALNWDPRNFNRGSGKKVEWKCSEGHEWKAVISNRALQGKGCPTCADSGFDPNLPAYLYFLIQDKWEMFQIGITNDLPRRIKEHSRNDWEVVEVRGPIEGHLTQQWETAILRMLKAKGADLSNEKIAGKFDGYSEAWSKSTFEAKSIKELMQLTEEFEEK